MIIQFHDTLITIENPIKVSFTKHSFNSSVKPTKQTLSQMILNTVAKLAPAIRHVLEKLTILLIPLPIFMLIIGIEGIIEQNSPENLASLGTVGTSFISLLGVHSLIIAGALGVTFIVWFLTRKIWNNSEDNSFDEDFSENNSESSEYTDEYEEFVDEELVRHKHSHSHS